MFDSADRAAAFNGYYDSGYYDEEGFNVFGFDRGGRTRRDIEEEKSPLPSKTMRKKSKA